MKKLCDLVDIAINNENCVVFNIKDGMRMDLIALGCFKGNEEMIRMTKGRTPEITVFNKDGSDYSYHFGEGSTTIISDNMQQQRTMIRECAILDYGLICDWSHMSATHNYEALVEQNLHVQSMDDAIRNVSLASGGGMTCNLRVNHQTMALHIDVSEVHEWFQKRGYDVDFEGVDILQGVKCGVTYGYCEPVSTLDKVLADATVASQKTTVNDKTIDTYNLDK